MLKRSFDIIASALIIMVFFPLFLLIAVLIKLDSSGAVIHCATRVGQNGRPFALYKFRTMVEGASGIGPGITREGDPRITRLGEFLRKYKIDELPQVVNVLKGEMSMVGPRPEDARFVAQYTPDQRRVLSIRPGMASPAAVKYRHEEEVLGALGDDVELSYRTVILPDKLRMDLDYVEHSSLARDIAVLARVAVSLLSRRKV